MALSPDFLKPQLTVGKGFGAPSSATVAFELLGGDAYSEAKRQGQVTGLLRLGPRGMDDTSPDTRPFILEPLVAASTVTDADLWRNTRGDISNADAFFFGTSNRQFGGGKSISFTNNAFPNIWEFSSPLQIDGGPVLSTNESWGIRADVSDVSDGTSEKNANGHIVYFGWGEAGRGWMLQIRDGSPQILHLAPGWNATDETALHLLYMLDYADGEEDQAAADLAEIRRLEKLLYDVSESLSFEGGLGRDEWRGAGWALVFIPEPRGVNQLPAGQTERGFYDPLAAYSAGDIVIYANVRWKATGDVLGVVPGDDDTKWQRLGGTASQGKPGALHFLLEGGAGAVLDLIDFEFLDSDGVPHPPTGDLWRETGFRVGATGGAVGWQILKVAFPPNGTAEWGWYGSGTDTRTWDNLQATIDATGPGKDANGQYLTSATLEKLDDLYYGPDTPPVAPATDPTPGPVLDLPSLRFKLRATLATTDQRYPPIVHAINARKPNGVRTTAGDTTVLTDTANISTDAQPITNIQLKVDESGARSCEFTLRDVNGKTKQNKTLDDFAGHLGTFNLGGETWLTNGPIIKGRDNELRRLGLKNADSGVVARGGYQTSNPETNFELTLDDGRWLDADTKLEAPLVLDGQFLGAAVRLLKLAVGWSPAEIALIPSIIGPPLPSRSAGEPWAYVVDKGASVDGAIQGLLDRFGFGLRYGRNRYGVWFLEKPPLAFDKFAFTSDGTQNDPNLLRGGTREMLLRPLVWEIDLDNYHTRFSVVGGLRGQIRKPLVNRAAVVLGPGNIAGPYYRGHHKDYDEVVDPGLRSEADVNYCLMSLQWRYGRPGRTSQAKSYLHRDLIPWDRGTVDDVKCEITQWSATLDAAEKERMQPVFKEVV